MNFYDINRFAAAVLGSILFVIVLIVAGNFIFKVDELERNAVGEIETAAPETTAEAEAEAEAGDVAEAEATAEAGAGAGAGAGDVVSLAALLAQGSVEAGQRMAKRCAACHTFEEGGRNGIGPSLWGSLGSPRAANAGYRYSDALATLGGDWGYAELDAFLEKPRSAVPGTKMSFAGIKDAQDRANLILYLRSVSDVELPLPPTGE